MNKNDYKIRLETPADYKAVENLTREAFWNVYRPGCLEHFVIYKLRDDENFIKELSFVLEKDGEIIGHIAFMRATITTFNGQNIPIATFGPISISPHYQRCGFGKILLDFALNKAKSMGIGAICMEGNIDFYGKCGFVVASTKKIHYHAEPIENDVPYFLLKELMPRYLDGIEGIYHTPKAYFVDENEAEEFDKAFPQKQKLKLPTQIF